MGEFSGFDAIGLLRETQKAVGGAEMVEQHKLLMNGQQDVEGKQNQIDAKQSKINSVRLDPFLPFCQSVPLPFRAFAFASWRPIDPSARPRPCPGVHDTTLMPFPVRVRRPFVAFGACDPIRTHPFDS